MLSVCQHLVLGALTAVALGYVRISAERCAAEQLVRGSAFDDVFRITVEADSSDHWTMLEFGVQISNRSILVDAGANVAHRASLTIVAPAEHADWRVTAVPDATAERVTLLGVARPPAPVLADTVLEVRVSYLPDERGCYGALGLALLTSVTLFKSDAPSLDIARGIVMSRCGHLQDVECVRDVSPTKPSDLRRRYTIFAFLCVIAVLLLALR